MPAFWRLRPIPRHERCPSSPIHTHIHRLPGHASAVPSEIVISMWTHCDGASFLPLDTSAGVQAEAKLRGLKRACQGWRSCTGNRSGGRQRRAAGDPSRPGSVLPGLESPAGVVLFTPLLGPREGMACFLSASKSSSHPPFPIPFTYLGVLVPGKGRALKPRRCYAGDTARSCSRCICGGGGLAHGRPHGVWRGGKVGIRKVQKQDESADWGGASTHGGHTAPR